MWASSLSHNGLTGCGTDGGDWASHQLEHELGGMFDVAHGAGLSAIWGSFARYVYKDNLLRFAKFAVKVHKIAASGKDLTSLPEEELDALAPVSYTHLSPSSESCSVTCFAFSFKVSANFCSAISFTDTPSADTNALSFALTPTAIFVSLTVLPF